LRELVINFLVKHFIALGIFLFQINFVLARPLYFMISQMLDGKGDVAANILLSRQFKELDPSLDIRFLLPRADEKDFRLLAEEDEVGRALFASNHSHVNEVLRVHGQGNLPVFCFACMRGFAVVYDFINENIEYRKQGQEKHPLLQTLVRDSLGNSVYEFGEQGRAPFYYIVPKEEDSDFKKRPNFVYAYSHSSYSQLIYFLALERYLRAEGVSGTVDVWSNHPNVFQELDVEGLDSLMSRFRFVSGESKMQSHERAIQESSYPPLVTGDVSFSFAVQAAQAFVYERRFHKQNMYLSFISQFVLSQRNAFNGLAFLDEAASIELKDNVSYQEMRIETEELFQFLSNAPLLESFAKWMRDQQKDFSLALALLSLLQKEASGQGCEGLLH